MEGRQAILRVPRTDAQRIACRQVACPLSTSPTWNGRSASSRILRRPGPMRKGLRIGMWMPWPRAALFAAISRPPKAARIFRVAPGPMRRGLRIATPPQATCTACRGIAWNGNAEFQVFPPLLLRCSSGRLHWSRYGQIGTSIGEVSVKRQKPAHGAREERQDVFDVT